jgi:NADPH:quinone reductase-like Zn-dependent oxidoreductase
MYASFINSYGGLEVLQYGELPNPVLTEDKIIINVKAVSINPLDYKIRNGNFKFLTGSKFPRILGGDFSGVVKEVGKDITNFKVGDAVYGFVPIHIQRFAALAEYISIKPKHIKLIPHGLSFEQAASLPVAALTALNGLRLCGDIKGKQVLINGATGGVGHFAVQIAKAKSAVVTAVCSSRNIDFAKQLGADSVIDYTKENFTQANKQYDVVFDAFANRTFNDVSKSLTSKGLFLTTLFRPNMIWKMIFLNISGGKKIIPTNMRSKPEDYFEIERLIKENLLTPFIERTFHLQDVKEAFAVLEKGGIKGKVVIKI